MQETKENWPLIVEGRSDTSSAKTENAIFQIYQEYLKTVAHWDLLQTSSEKFFSAVSTAIFSGYVVIIKDKVELSILATAAIFLVAIWIAVAWILTNISYAKMVSIKMEVAQEIEELLPVRPLKYEWEEKIKKQKYIRISRIQRVFPLMFIALYLILAADYFFNNAANVL